MTDPRSAARSGPVVFKFGGTSVADAARVRHVAGVVRHAAGSWAAPAPVVVVSAAGDVTDRLTRILEMAPAARAPELDRLLAWHEELLAELSETPPHLPTEAVSAARAALDGLGGFILSPEPNQLPSSRVLAAVDAFLALGEDLSTLSVVTALEAAGLPARGVDSRTLVLTDDRHGFARPDEPAIRAAAAARLVPLAEEGVVAVVQGFVGGTPDGATTTLGRGGSDLTASLLGAALDSPEVHIWTDVPGVLSADPRVVEAPESLAVVGFEEAVELAYFGARVLHSGAAKHAVANGVPVRIRSTFEPDHPGTLILEDRWAGAGIAAVASKPHVALIRVRGRPSALPYGFLARVFEILARHRVPVDLVATSHTSTAFTVDESEEMDAVAAELEEVAEVTVRRGLSTVTVVGNGLLREPGFDARVFNTVALTPIHLVSQASDVSLSFVVDAGDAPRMVAQLHAELVEGRAASGAEGGARTSGAASSGGGPGPVGGSVS
jgi:aspartate kinase